MYMYIYPIYNTTVLVKFQHNAPQGQTPKDIQPEEEVDALNQDST